MKKFSPWWIIAAVVVVLGLWMTVSYNGFISSKASVDNMWAQVETQYQRRVDLVPNLVSTVKGAASFEQDTLKQVTDARSAWAQAKTVGSREGEITAATSMESAISRLLVTVESYPQLQATQAFRDLMTQLEGTENRIAVARKDYNEAVMGYNVKVQRFPSMLLARVFGFSAEKAFEAQEGADKAPNVDFTK